jgi:23S rRNA (adenine2030-N6)-methyltransferase
MQAFSREIDTLHANELSPDICQRLRDNIVGDNMHIHQRDAFEVLNALLPPEPKRGFVLIDPPYEQALEYQKLTMELGKALKKWPRGIYAIWYPMLSPRRINRRSGLEEDTPKASLAAKMLNDITDTAAKFCSGGVIDIQFAAMAPNENTGMYGSGVVIINPPYLLESDLKEILEALCDKVKVDNNRLSNLKWRLAAA